MRKLYIISLGLLVAMGIFIGSNSLNATTSTVAAPVVSAPAMPQSQYRDVNPLELISNPYKYLNRNIRITGKFDKFSALGLDYKPAMREHDKYISFLIQRPDVKDHDIPLSELKIFLKKEVAEKHIDLNAGDEVRFSGRVFSTALGDPWMDVDTFEVINKVKKEVKK